MGKLWHLRVLPHMGSGRGYSTLFIIFHIFLSCNKRTTHIKFRANRIIFINFYHICNQSGTKAQLVTIT